MENLCALVMAAGKGTRMVSNRAKVLHSVCGVPMLRMIYRAVAPLSPERLFVIIGHDAERVRASLSGPSVDFILQAEQLGTGHAVITAKEALAGRQGDVLILFGDTPRIKTQTLEKLVRAHRHSGADTTLLTVRAVNPFGYGRIIRAADGQIAAIVEEKDATPEQKKIDEVNPGFYCFRIETLIDSLGALSNNNAQKEYYITDLVDIQRRAGKRVEAILHEDFEELRGVNSRKDLAEASLSLGRDKNLSLMAAGVTLIDPDRTTIELDVVIGKDVTIHPQVTLQGSTRIGEGVEIFPGARITNSIIGKDARILDSSIIVDSEIGEACCVGPSAHVRDNSRIGEHSRIGNFVEVARSEIGAHTMAAHLAYLGDAVVGRNVNIGAGVITCNYDGRRKNATIIGDNAFVGTDSQLVAPVRIGEGAYVAAGSCITEDLPPGALGICRNRQVVKENWVRDNPGSGRKND